VSGAVKTVLVVGGVAVGAFVLLKVLAPAPASTGVRPGQTSSTAASLIGLIPSVVSAGQSIFGSSSKPPAGSTSDAYYKPGESYDDYTSSIFGPGINPDGTGA
jgi:hypothetical protein